MQTNLMGALAQGTPIAVIREKDGVVYNYVGVVEDYDPLADFEVEMRVTRCLSHRKGSQALRYEPGLSFGNLLATRSQVALMMGDKLNG